MAIELPVSSRTVLGKKVKNIRGEGMIPGELYGRGVPNRHISVAAKEFARVYREAGENTIVSIRFENGEKIPTLIAHADKDLFSGTIRSVDFHQIRMDEAIETEVPVMLAGDSPAVKAGLVLLTVHNEITVKSLPQNIPHEFIVDISRLENPGDSISVKDLIVPKDVKIVTPQDTVLVNIQEQQKEEEAQAPAPAETDTKTETGTAPTAAEESAEKEK